MITAQGTRAGSNQISDTRESGKSQGMSAGGKAQAREFSQSACNKGSFGIIPHIYAVIDTRTNCNNVLERPAKFNTHDIICCVDTIVGGSKQSASVYCYLLIVSRHNSRGRLSLRYFTRHIWPA